MKKLLKDKPSEASDMIEVLNSKTRGKLEQIEILDRTAHFGDKKGVVEKETDDTVTYYVPNIEDFCRKVSF